MDTQLLESLKQLVSKHPTAKDFISKNVNDDKEMIEQYNKYFKIQKNTKMDFSKLQKIYDNGISAVNQFNLTVNPKEFVCLLGPSGCGKSTTLRMVAGLEMISSGTFKINDVIVNALQPSQRGLSMVFQNYALYPYMTVYNNIAFGLKLKRRKNTLVKAIDKEIQRTISKDFDSSERIKEQIRLLKHPHYQELETYKELLAVHRVKKSHEDVGELKNKIKKLKAEDKASAFKSKNEIAKLRKKLIEVNTNPLLFIPYFWIFSPKSKEIMELRKIRRFAMALWKRSIPARVRMFAELVDIGDYLQRKPSALSGGQRQRVALARTISKDTNILLFDEPLSNLDAKLRASMRKEIKNIHSKLEATTIYVTHDQIEAMTMADKVVVMNKGYILQVDTPQNLFDNPANLFVANFIGTPEMNILEGKIISNKEVQVGNTKLMIENPKNINLKIGENVSVGIRPQNISAEDDIARHMTHNVVEGIITYKQLIGNDYIVTVKSKELGTEIDLIINTYKAGEIGDKIKFYLGLRHIHLFDKKTERSLLADINPETIKSLKEWEVGVPERLKNKLIIQKEKTKQSIGEIIYKNSKANIIGIVNDSFKRNIIMEKLDGLQDHEKLLKEQIELIETKEKKEKLTKKLLNIQEKIINYKKKLNQKQNN